MSLKCFGKEKQVDIDKNMHVKFRREAKMLRALDESVTQYVGGRLFVKVHYGWGWQRTEPDATATSNQAAEAPPDFFLRVLRFFQWQGVLRGAVAKIEESGHPYDGYWAVFYTRPLGTYNFTDNITTYSVQVGPDEPIMLDPSAEPELAEYWPLWEFSGVPQLLGFGMIAVAPDCVDRWEQEHTLKPGQAHGLMQRT